MKPLTSVFKLQYSYNYKSLDGLILKYNYSNLMIKDWVPSINLEIWLYSSMVITIYFDCSQLEI